MENATTKLDLRTFFKNQILKHQLSNGDTVIVGVSGGLDSMTLLNLVKESGLLAIVAHVNYGLRAQESLRDRNFVRDFCLKHALKFEELNASQDMHLSDKRSTQMKARDIRRGFFEQLLLKYEAKFIMLAQHADDQLETFFIQFFRNQGLFSLAGMDEKNGFWFRPLIDVRRNEIHQFAIENKIEWLEDSSNEKETYLRNKIRHRIVPEIENLGAKSKHKAIESVARLNSDRSALIQLFSEAEQSQKQALESGFRIEKASLLKFQDPKSYLDFLFRELDVSYALIKQIASNLTSNETKVFYCNDVKISIDRAYLSVYQTSSKVSTEENEEYAIIISEEIPETDFNNLIFSRLEAILDASTIHSELYLRKWRNADRFWPAGMEGSKLLSDYFTDHKFSELQKQEQWLLCHGDDIVWLVNQRVDRRFMYKSGCKKAIRVRVSD
jgi:tRNA(Ile)-lysidine synthase